MVAKEKHEIEGVAFDTHPIYSKPIEESSQDTVGAVIIKDLPIGSEDIDIKNLMGKVAESPIASIGPIEDGRVRIEFKHDAGKLDEHLAKQL